MGDMQEICAKIFLKSKIDPVLEKIEGLDVIRGISANKKVGTLRRREWDNPEPNGSYSEVCRICEEAKMTFLISS